jgi:hypothetical protein
MLACDAGLRQDLGRRAREGYERHYTQNHYIQRYLDVIAATLKRPLAANQKIPTFN